MAVLIREGLLYTMKAYVLFIVIDHLLHVLYAVHVLWILKMEMFAPWPEFNITKKTEFYFVIIPPLHYW